MGIERDRVFHVNFEQGKTELDFVNLANNIVTDAGTATAQSERTTGKDPLFGNNVLDLTTGAIPARVDFTNPELVRPLNEENIEYRFAIWIPTATANGAHQLFVEDEGGAAESYKVDYFLDAAGDELRFTMTQSLIDKLFTFDFGVAAFTRDTWLQFRITFDKVTMRAYLNGTRLGSGVTKASVMTGDFDEANAAFFTIGRHDGGSPDCYIDHLMIERGGNSVMTDASYPVETESFQKEAPVFPVAVSQGSGTGPGFKTDVLRIESGHELRETPNLNNRNNFTVSLINKGQLELENLINLAHISRGRARVFRYKDWLEFSTTTPDGTIGISDQIIGTGDGVVTAFQLTKTFLQDTDKSNVDHVRTITRPVPGTVRVSIDDVETFAFYVDHGSGKLFFTTAPLAGEVIKWGGEYDIPCRFNNDDIRLNMQAFENGQSSFDLIEVING